MGEFVQALFCSKGTEDAGCISFDLQEQGAANYLLPMDKGTCNAPTCKFGHSTFTLDYPLLYLEFEPSGAAETGFQPMSSA